MRPASILAMCVLLASGNAIGAEQNADEKVVIAHRGASGYLPEHTLEAKTAAYFMGSDYLEQDVVMTRDDNLIVLHDRYLDRVTDVAEKYPTRFRMVDGQKRWLAIDFDLDEIRTLAMTEGFNVNGGDFNKANTTPIFPERFPAWESSFRIHTLQEEIEMIQGLNKSTGKDVGIYPEIKVPWFHRHEGKDISKAVLTVLKKYGYTQHSDNVYLQSFDPIENKRVAKELMPAMGMDLKLVQLMTETSSHETMVYKDNKLIPYNYDWMFQPGGMTEIAKYADAIGPSKSFLIDEKSTKDKLVITSMVDDAHKAGLEVHPYTFRADEGCVPAYAKNFDDMLDIFLNKVDVDGLFTDFPDQAVNFIQHQDEIESKSEPKPDDRTFS